MSDMDAGHDRTRTHGQVTYRQWKQKEREKKRAEQGSFLDRLNRVPLWVGIPLALLTVVVVFVLIVLLWFVEPFIAFALNIGIVVPAVWAMIKVGADRMPLWIQIPAGMLLGLLGVVLLIAILLFAADSGNWWIIVVLSPIWLPLAWLGYKLS